MKEIDFSATIVSLFITVIIAAVIYIVPGLITKNFRKSGLAASIFLLFFLGFGHLLELVQEISDFGGHADVVTLVPWIILLAVALFFAIRNKSDLAKATKLMNVISICLILIPFFSIVSFMLFKEMRDYSVLIKRTDVKLSAKPEEKRDIYLVILDGYGRDDVLREMYGFNNDEFIRHLEEKGFYVNRKATTNYPITLGSLPSTLNFRYLDDTAKKAKEMGLNESDFTAYIRMLKHNDAMRLLKDAGYTTVALSTEFFGTDIEDVDIFLDLDIALNQFERAYYNTTPLAALLGLFAKEDSYNHERRKRIRNAFDKIPKIGKEVTPKFIYAHIIAPHPSFVFGPDGEEITPRAKRIMLDGMAIANGELTKEEYVDGYIKQLRFVNKRTVELVDGILENSKIEPIIIILSDHGPDSEFYPYREKTNLKERFSNLAAYYLPGMDSGKIPEGMSSVNVFRLIFKNYFDADLELLPDRQYFVSFNDINSFEDVTEMLDNKNSQEPGEKKNNSDK
jgi:hypothetical protein